MLGGAALLNESPETDMIPDIPSDAADNGPPEASTDAPPEVPEIQEENTARVAIVKTADREDGIARAAALLGEMDFSGKDVYLKGSYNSPDPFPATTHPDALGAMIRLLRGKGARGVRLLKEAAWGAPATSWKSSVF